MGQTQKQQQATKRNHLIMRLRGAAWLFREIEHMNASYETRGLAANLRTLTNNLEMRLCQDYEKTPEVFNLSLFHRNPKS